MADDILRLEQIQVDQDQIIQEEPEFHRYYGKKPTNLSVCFDLMLQFIDRCIEDGRDATPFRNAAIFIATGCSVEGKTPRCPTGTGGLGRPWLG